MKNAVIGFICVVILIFTGVAIQTASGRNVRQNELDTNLAVAMEQSMKVLTIDPLYVISRENPEEFAADFIQNMLLVTTSDARFQVMIHKLDVVKGLLDVTVTEYYRQLVGEGTVHARKSILLEDYENDKNQYFTVSFLDSSQENRIIKQVQIHGGDVLAGRNVPQNIVIPKDSLLRGWRLTSPPGMLSGTLYDQTNIQQIIVTQNLEFTTEYVKKQGGIE